MHFLAAEVIDEQHMQLTLNNLPLELNKNWGLNNWVFTGQ